MKYGIETIERSANGTAYTITDQRHSVFARVEETNGVYNVRDVYDDPVRVGSVRYDIAIRAIKHYKAWAASH